MEHSVMDIIELLSQGDNWHYISNLPISDMFTEGLRWCTDNHMQAVVDGTGITISGDTGDTVTYAWKDVTIQWVCDQLQITTDRVYQEIIRILGAR